MTEIPNQLDNPAIAHMLTNHPKTVPAVVSITMNASSPKEALKAIATIGKPLLVRYENILGAFPATAKLCKALDEEYRSDDDADQAEVSTAALITDGRLFMPAVLMAITNGERAAVEVARRRSG